MEQSKRYTKFTKDCEKAGLVVRDYQGRYFYHGPAVSCQDIGEVLQVTRVKCQWDQLGKGYIVYPR
jgi:hypothetical protein